MHGPLKQKFARSHLIRALLVAIESKASVCMFRAFEMVFSLSDLLVEALTARWNSICGSLRFSVSFFFSRILEFQSHHIFAYNFAGVECVLDDLASTHRHYHNYC